ncbi:hypothetical protein [Vibrio sp. C8]
MRIQKTEYLFTTNHYLFDKKFLVLSGYFLLREKKYDLIIALLLDDSQSEYITAVLWQGDRATIQE